MKRVFIFLGCLILGPVLGCLLSVFWYSGANTFWKPIDYFPYQAKEILSLKEFGKEFWVKTTNDEIYRITYPCSQNQTCWTKADNVLSSFSEDGIAKYTISNNKCQNNNFVYPLLYKVKMCATTIMPAESLWTSSLALTDNNKLWIWNKPWDSPYNELSGIIFVMILGAVIGIIFSIFWIQKLS